MCAVRAEIVRRTFPDGSRTRQEVTDRSRLQIEKFQALYASNRLDILKYFVRRCTDTDAAADSLSETFLVAWRRIEVVPDGLEGRLWLFGVARNVLAKQFKKRQLTIRINERLATELRTASPTPATDGVGSEMHKALSQLSKSDREIVELSAWEELAPGEIASVLGISANAARVRLHRARHRLSQILVQSNLRDRDIELLP
jgi:RNA polymerase sigma-70 factor (ECF subfamily)